MTKSLILPVALCMLACGSSQNTGTSESTGAAGTSPTGGNQEAAPDKRTAKTNDAGEFKINEGNKSSRPSQGKLKPTATEAAVRFFVVDKNKGPVKGIVISLTDPDGKKHYTGETDAEGFVEVLLPIGKTYKLVYLSLGRRDVAAKVTVANTPRLNLKLTMRYEREEYPIGLVLDNINFPTGKATLTQESHRRLKTVVEFMKYKKSATIEISGHTDNVGNKRANKKLSQRRAEAVREYIVSQGIDGARVKSVGYGDGKPIASNKTQEGREKNRRIEAKEL